MNDEEIPAPPSVVWNDDKKESHPHLTWNYYRLIFGVLLASASAVAILFGSSTTSGNTVVRRLQSVNTDAPSVSPPTIPLSPALPPSLLTWSAPGETTTAESSSEMPSDLPSYVPSTTPTIVPTTAPIPPNPVPDNPPPGYFNYDPSSEYGPEHWHKVDTSQTWLREFGNEGWGPWKGHIQAETPLTQNLCAAAARKQSPKDLSAIAPCDATHEIRTKCAVDALQSDAYIPQILPHKLSIQAVGRPCLDVLQNGLGIGTCRDNQPPMVDYPTYSSQGSDYSDMHHFDIKVPGEHTVMGETFDAEIQMFHVHLNDPRMSSIGIPIRAIGDDTNQDFQAVLDEFELVYEENWLACDGGDGGNETLIDAAAPGEARPNQFDPYVFMTSMYFYRYDGSITEPPCRDITWWVMSDPLVISRAQLDQLKRLLLTNVDPDTCEFTCTHHEESVARPIQPLGENRVIEACGVGDFESDVEKGRPPAKQCREWKQEESWLW